MAKERISPISRIGNWISARKLSIGLYALSVLVATGATLAARDIERKDPILVKHPQTIRDYLDVLDSYKKTSSEIERICDEKFPKYLEGGYIKKIDGETCMLFDSDAMSAARKKALDDMRNNSSYDIILSKHDSLKAKVDEGYTKYINYSLDNKLPIITFGYLPAFACFLGACAVLADEDERIKRNKKL